MSSDPIEIICINRDDQPDDCRCITWVGTRSGDAYPVNDVISLIESGIVFFVSDQNDDVAIVEIANRDGRQYIRTRPDDTIDDNLLQLDLCEHDFRQ